MFLYRADGFASRGIRLFTFSSLILVALTSVLLTARPLSTEARTTETDPVLVGAGDIASCSSDGDEATANLLDVISGTVFTLGDNVYDSGTSSEFANCYAPSWGRHLARTRPSPGNHDYTTES